MVTDEKVVLRFCGAVVTVVCGVLVGVRSVRAILLLSWGRDWMGLDHWVWPLVIAWVEEKRVACVQGCECVQVAVEFFYRLLEYRWTKEGDENLPASFRALR